MSTPNRPVALAVLSALALAVLAGPLACRPRYHHQRPSWEPPTASNERVRHVFEQADATPPEGLLPGQD